MCNRGLLADDLYDPCQVALEDDERTHNSILCIVANALGLHPSYRGFESLRIDQKALTANSTRSAKPRYIGSNPIVFARRCGGMVTHAMMSLDNAIVVQWQNR